MARTGSPIGRHGLDDVTGYPLCKRGHVRSPENLYPSGTCKQCAKIRRRSEIVKSKDAAYRNSELAKSRAFEYRNTEQEKNRRKTEIWKEYQLKYFQSEKGKACTKRKTSKKIELCKPSYIADLLKIPSSQLTPELLEIKRLKIQLERAIKCQKLQQAA